MHLRCCGEVPLRWLTCSESMTETACEGGGEKLLDGTCLCPFSLCWSSFVKALHEVTSFIIEEAFSVKGLSGRPAEQSQMYLHRVMLAAMLLVAESATQSGFVARQSVGLLLK